MFGIETRPTDDHHEALITLTSLWMRVDRNLHVLICNYVFPRSIVGTWVKSNSIRLFGTILDKDVLPATRHDDLFGFLQMSR